MILNSIESDLLMRQFENLSKSREGTPVVINKTFRLDASNFDSNKAYTPLDWNIYPECIPPKLGYYIVDVVQVYEGENYQEWSLWKTVCEWDGAFLRESGKSHDIRSDKKFKKFITEAKKELNETGTYGGNTDIRIECRFHAFYDGPNSPEQC